MGLLVSWGRSTRKLKSGRFPFYAVWASDGSFGRVYYIWADALSALVRCGRLGVCRGFYVLDDAYVCIKDLII